MLVPRSRHPHRRVFAGLACVAAALALGAAPASSLAATQTLGPDLSTPANLDTVQGLLPANHAGADEALWNTSGSSAPTGGQVLSVKVEGCAVEQGGVAPLTMIHFQTLTPQSDGSFKIDLTSQAFDIPICGQNADASTVTTYQPFNLCVSQGEILDFNDEGGYVPGAYPYGVPYLVLARSAGASMDSFIRDNGTQNGMTLAPWDTSSSDGFATESGQQVRMQWVLGSGADAYAFCPGGSRVYLRPGQTPPPPSPPRAPVSIVAGQIDGVNHSGQVAVSVFCLVQSGCSGTASMNPSGAATRLGRLLKVAFTIAGKHTGKVRFHVPSSLIARARRNGGRLKVLVTVTVPASAAPNSAAALVTLSVPVGHRHHH